MHIERAGFGLTERALEGVDGGPDPNTTETAELEHFLPACTRQATGNSAGPEIDVAQRFGWYRAPVGDVGELQHTAGTQHTEDLGED